MLPSDLLLSRRRGDQLVPRRLEFHRANLALAAELIDTFRAFTGRTRDDLDERLRRVAETLSRTEGKPVTPEMVANGLFADLPGAQSLVRFEPPEPTALLHRYNLAQAQGILYRA